VYITIIIIIIIIIAAAAAVVIVVVNNCTMIIIFCTLQLKIVSKRAFLNLIRNPQTSILQVS